MYEMPDQNATKFAIFHWNMKIQILVLSFELPDDTDLCPIYVLIMLNYFIFSVQFY